MATQDKDLRVRLSRLPGVPTIYFNKVIIVLEPPSNASKNNSLKVSYDIFYTTLITCRFIKVCISYILKLS